MQTKNIATLPAAYWAECVQDEAKLARLMGWALSKPVPENPVASSWLFGTNRGEFRSEVGPAVDRGAQLPLPRWRRDPAALGELLEAVPANVRWDDGAGMVYVWIDRRGATTAMQCQPFALHPSHGHALRKALLDLALEYLPAARQLSIGSAA